MLRLLILLTVVCVGTVVYAGQRGQSYGWERIKMRDPQTGL